MSRAGDGALPRIAPAVWVLVALKGGLHVLGDGSYGYFRDELYYIACSDHLAWGYVDHPPLSIAILTLMRALLGDSLFAIRAAAVLAGMLGVLLTALLARDLGGGRFAQSLAALAFVFTPVLLGFSSFYSMNAFEPLFWLLLAWVVVRIIRAGDPRLWLLFGAVAGIGMENKISVGFLVFGIVVGLALTTQRRHLMTGWFWLGAAVAVLTFLPHLLWQAENGFPTLEFMRNAAGTKIRAMAPLQYLGAQVVYTIPALFVWLAGLVYLLVAPAARPFRLLGFAYLAVLALLVAQQAKAYYLAAAYPILFAAGGVAWERITAGPGGRWVRVILALVVIGAGAGTAPLALPVLPPESLVRYSAALGVETPREERQQRVALAQHFADRFGWENLVATVARVYDGLTPEERRRAAIFAGNYGEAGAIDFFGQRYGLPRAISGHNNYWLWGPRNTSGEVIIAVGARREHLEELFTDVEQAAVVVSPWAMQYETDLPVFVCRGLRRPLPEVWKALKRFV